jgi:RNA polymerase sigma factor (TIGR02999 family)
MFQYTPSLFLITVDPAAGMTVDPPNVVTGRMLVLTLPLLPLWAFAPGTRQRVASITMKIKVLFIFPPFFISEKVILKLATRAMEHFRGFTYCGERDLAENRLKKVIFAVYLRDFAVLMDWMKENGQVGEARKITKLLHNWSDGDETALNELFPLVYDELHRQAGKYLRGERPGHTLQTTALLHEAYIRLAGHSEGSWENRFQFFAFAAKIMRNILVDHARAKQREKRGAGALKISLADISPQTPELDLDLLALDEALDRLNKIDEQQVRVVELRYFGGLSLEEAAEALEISRATVVRDWNVARAWLHRELTR